MSRLLPGEMKLWLKRRLVAGAAAAERDQEREESNSYAAVSSMMCTSAFFIWMFELVAWSTGKGTSGINLTFCRRKVANKLFRPGIRSPDDVDLGQPQLLLEVDPHQVDAARVGVHVDTGDDAQRAESPASPSNTRMSTTSVAPAGSPPGWSNDTVTENGVAGVELDAEAAQYGAQQKAAGVEHGAEQPPGTPVRRIR